MSQKPIKDHLAAPDSFGTTLLAIVMDEYGSEALQWAPETLRMELQTDFGAELSPRAFSKLLAAIHVVTSDDFYRRLPLFIQLCNALSGTDLEPAEFNEADPLECAWGMTEAMLLSPPDPDDEEPYADEIRWYLGSICDHYGIREPPDLLRLALRDTPSGRTDYSDMSLDDPSAFAADFQVQQDQSEQIKKAVEERLQTLFEQLDALPLRHGRTQGLLQRMQRAAKNV